MTSLLPALEKKVKNKMNQAETLRQLLKEIEEQLERNINEDGECQFSYLKEKIVLEMAKEIITDGVPDPPMCFTSC